MIPGENGYRVQSEPLRAARAQLMTLSAGEIDPLVAAAAISAIDGTLPSYPPAEILPEGGSFSIAQQRLREAIEVSDSVLELGRLGDALDLLALHQ